MAWIKRNLVFVIGAAMALVLIVFVAVHNYSGSKNNAEEIGIRQPSYTESKGLGTVNPNPRLDKGEVAVPQSRSSISEIAKLTLRCRAVIPSHVSSDAETTIAYAMQKELQASTRLFDPQTTTLGPEIHRDRDADTFTFDVALALKRPIKL